MSPNSVLAQVFKKCYELGHHVGLLSKRQTTIDTLVAEGILYLNDTEITPEEIPILCRFCLSKQSRQHLKAIQLSSKQKFVREASFLSKKSSSSSNSACSPFHLEGHRLLRAIIDLIRKGKSLKYIEFVYMALNPEILRKIGDALSHSSSEELKIVNFDHSSIGDDGFKSIYSQLGNTKVPLIKLSYCNLTDASADNINAMIRSQESQLDSFYWNSTLRSYPDEWCNLDLNDNTTHHNNNDGIINDDNDNNNNKDITNIKNKSIHKNNMDEDDEDFIISKIFQGLRLLNLSGNQLSTPTIFALKSCLSKNQWLISLDFSDNNFDENSIRLLARALSQNSSLVSLNLAGNPGYCDSLGRYLDAISTRFIGAPCVPSSMCPFIKGLPGQPGLPGTLSASIVAGLQLKTLDGNNAQFNSDSTFTNTNVLLNKLNLPIHDQAMIDDTLEFLENYTVNIVDPDIWECLRCVYNCHTMKQLIKRKEDEEKVKASEFGSIKSNNKGMKNLNKIDIDTKINTSSKSKVSSTSLKAKTMTTKTKETPGKSKIVNRNNDYSSSRGQSSKIKKTRKSSPGYNKKKNKRKKNKNGTSTSGTEILTSVESNNINTNNDDGVGVYVNLHEQSSSFYEGMDGRPPSRISLRPGHGRSLSFQSTLNRMQMDIRHQTSYSPVRLESEMEQLQSQPEDEYVKEIEEEIEEDIDSTIDVNGNTPNIINITSLSASEMDEVGNINPNSHSFNISAPAPGYPLCRSRNINHNNETNSYNDNKRRPWGYNGPGTEREQERILRLQAARRGDLGGGIGTSHRIVRKGSRNLSIDDFDYGINSHSRNYTVEDEDHDWDIHCEPRMVPANVYPSPHRPKIQLHNRNTEDVITEIQNLAEIDNNSNNNSNNYNNNNVNNSFHSDELIKSNQSSTDILRGSELQSILSSKAGHMPRKPPVPSHIVPVHGKVFNEKVYTKFKDDDLKDNDKIEMLNGSLLGRDSMTLDQKTYDDENTNRAIRRAIASEQINEFINLSSLGLDDLQSESQRPGYRSRQIQKQKQRRSHSAPRTRGRDRQRTSFTEKERTMNYRSSSRVSSLSNRSNKSKQSGLRRVSSDSCNSRSLEDTLLAVDLDGGIGASTHLLGQSIQAVMRNVLSTLHRRERMFLKSSEMETCRGKNIGRHIRDAITSYHNRYERELMKTEFRSIGKGLNPSVYDTSNSSPTSNTKTKHKNYSSTSSKSCVKNITNGSSRYSSNSNYDLHENIKNIPKATTATTATTTTSTSSLTGNNNVNNKCDVISNSDFGRDPMGNVDARPNTASPGVRGGRINTIATTNITVINDDWNTDEGEENHQYRDAFRVQDFNRYSPQRYKKNSNNEEVIEDPTLVNGGDDAVMLGGGRDSPNLYTFDNVALFTNDREDNVNSGRENNNK